MDKRGKFKVVFNAAVQFLNNIVIQHPKLNELILKQHLEQKSEFDNITDANRRLVESLQNRNMMTSVINFREKEERLRAILYDYNPKKIIQEYSTVDSLFRRFQDEFVIINGKRNLWRKFSEGILSGSKFLSSFKNKKEFDGFIHTFSLNKYTRAALPLLLSREIRGFGLALACDFLKELGYRDYPKPDRHLIKIFNSLGLSESEDPYDAYKSIVEMAEVVKKDAYTVDKVFWLIGSGKFNLVDIKVGNHCDKFIEYGNKVLREKQKSFVNGSNG